MKRLTALILIGLLLALCLPALAEGAQLPDDSQDFIPYDVRQFFSSPTFDGYTVRVGASMYFENTVGGSFFFTVVQKEGHNVLYGFQQKSDGRFDYFLKTDGAIPQGEGFFELHDLYGQHNLIFFDDPLYMSGDVLDIIFTRADYEEQADSSVWFEVNKNGQWNLIWAFFHYCWEGAQVGNDYVTYYLDEGNKVEGVKGVVERNLRYFSWDAFPKTLADAREKLSTPPAIPTGELTARRIKFEGGQKFPVYSGPGEQYQRLGNGKAAVSTNDWIQVFGSESGYILIQYDITSDQMRFGWIEQSALPKGASVSPLRFAYEDAVIVRGDALTDDPLYSQTRQFSLPLGAEVKWLAKMGDWVYVEYAGAGSPVRGFVSASSVQKNTAETPAGTYEASYHGADYQARAALTMYQDGRMDVSVSIDAPESWENPVTAYQLYANQTPLAYLTPGADRTFSGTVSLPENTAVVGLCPVHQTGGLKAEGMMTLTLRAAPAAKVPFNAAAVNNPNPAERLHLRSQPDAASASMGKYYNGTQVTLIVDKGDYGEFSHVTAGGMSGYMMTKYLAFGDAALKVNDARPVVTVRNEAGTGLNLRAAPSLDGQVLSLLPNGTQVTVNGLNEEWLNVTAGERTGWIKANGVTPRPAYDLYGSASSGSARKARIVADCSVYTEPVTAETLQKNGGSTEKLLIGVYAPGDQVTVYQTRDGYAQVNYGSGRGWIPLDSLEYINSFAVSSGKKARITADCSVYSSPEDLPYDAGDARSNIASTAYSGAEVTVYQVKNGFAQVGVTPGRWVHTSVIRYLDE